MSCVSYIRIATVAVGEDFLVVSKISRDQTSKHGGLHVADFAAENSCLVDLDVLRHANGFVETHISEHPSGVVVTVGRLLQSTVAIVVA